MAGTDASTCSVCGEGYYDKPDRVGGVCPDCWAIQQLERDAAEAQRLAEVAVEAVKARRKEREDTLKERGLTASGKASVVTAPGKTSAVV